MFRSCQILRNHSHATAQRAKLMFRRTNRWLLWNLSEKFFFALLGEICTKILLNSGLRLDYFSDLMILIHDKYLDKQSKIFAKISFVNRLNVLSNCNKWFIFPIVEIKSLWNFYFCFKGRTAWISACGSDRTFQQVNNNNTSAHSHRRFRDIISPPQSIHAFIPFTCSTACRFFIYFTALIAVALQQTFYNFCAAIFFFFYLSHLRLVNPW